MDRGQTSLPVRLNKQFSLAPINTARPLAVIEGDRRHIAIVECRSGGIRRLDSVRLRAFSGLPTLAFSGRRGATLYAGGTQLSSIDWKNDTATNLPVVGNIAGVRCSEDGANLAFLIRWSRTSPISRICILNTLDGSVSTVLEESCIIDALDVAWAPRLALFRRIRTVNQVETCLLDLSGGSPPVVVSDAQCALVRLRPDGKGMALVGRTLRVLMFGRSQRKHGGGGLSLANDAEQVAWSPDSRALAYTRHDSELWIADTHEGTTDRIVSASRRTFRQKTRGASYSPTPAWSSDGKLLAFGLFSWRRAPRTATILGPELQRAVDTVPPEQKAEVRKSLHRSFGWEPCPQMGVVDVSEKRVSPMSGSWAEMVWGPEEAKIR